MYPAPPSVPAFIAVSPAALTLQLGGNQIQLTARLTDTTGAPIAATQPFRLDEQQYRSPYCQ